MTGHPYALHLHSDLEPEELRSWLREREPWSIQIEFDNGVSTSEFERRVPFSTNPLQKISIAAKSLPIETLRGGAVLDIGCAMGYNSIHMARTWDMRPVGVDFNPKHVQTSTMLAELAGVDAEFVVGSAEEFVRPGAFDLVVHFGTLYHLPSPLRSLELAFENLRPGGYLAIESQFYTHPDDENLCCFMHMQNNDPTNFWALSPSVFERYLGMVGFVEPQQLLKTEPAMLEQYMSRQIWIARRPGTRSLPRQSEQLSSVQGEQTVVESIDSWCERLIAHAGGAHDPELADYPAEDVQKIPSNLAGATAMEKAAPFYRILEEEAEIGADTRILDFGCGWGRMARFLLRTANEAHIAGVDVEERTLKEAQRAMPNGDFRLIEPNSALPFEDQQFDLVFSNSVFSHLSEGAHHHYMAEIARVLRPGGVGLLTFIDHRHFERTMNNPDSWMMKLMGDPVELRPVFARDGFLYKHSGRIEDYGLTFIHHDWLAANLPPGLRLDKVRTDYHQAIARVVRVDTEVA